MFTRIVTISLVALLMFPVALTRMEDTSPSPWGNVAVAAKGKPHHGHKHKKHKKHDQMQLPSTVTRTVRQPLTQTFSSSERIAVPGDSDMIRPTAGKATPYPSAIEVSGLSNGVVTDVNVILNDFTHTASADVDVLLSKSDGRQALVMSDVGGAGAIGVDLKLDDEAAALPRRETLLSGTFQPTDIASVVGDGFDAPAPTPSGAVALQTFDGADPNGTWQLWVMDNSGQDVGEFTGGWALEITAEVDVQVQEPAPDHANHQDKQHGQQHNERDRARKREG